MWSGPRNLSTALMRSFENRNDTIVIDEPFYAYYLKKTQLDHPMKNEIINYYPTSQKEILKIDSKNPMANYRVLMDEGLKYHRKDYKNGQWDAIQSFSRASTFIDTVGEPYYWMGKAYEKKDEMDYELPLESYNRSLELYLTDDMRLKVSQSIEGLIKRKKTYEDFWK